MKSLVAPSTTKPTKFVAVQSHNSIVATISSTKFNKEKKARLEAFDKEKRKMEKMWDLCQFKDNELVIKSSSVQSFLDLVGSGDAFGDRVPEPTDSSFATTGTRSDWTTYPNFDEFIVAATKSPEDFRDFDESDLALSEWESIGNQVSYETNGDFIDMGRFLEGQPECFGQMRDGQVQNKFCTIIVNGCASCGVDNKTIAYRSKRILRLVDALENNKVRCQVVVVYSTNQIHVEITVKQFYDPLELNQLALATSADFFRWAVFRATEHSAIIRPGYGRSAEVDPRLLVEADDTEMIIYTGSLNSNCIDKMEKSFNELEKSIKNNGINDGDVKALVW